MERSSIGACSTRSLITTPLRGDPMTDLVTVLALREEKGA